MVGLRRRHSGAVPQSLNRTSVPFPVQDGCSGRYPWTSKVMGAAGRRFKWLRERRSHQRNVSGSNQSSSLGNAALREWPSGNRRCSRCPSGNSMVLNIIITGLERADCILRFPGLFPLAASGSGFSLPDLASPGLISPDLISPGLGSPGLASPEGATSATLAVASLLGDDSFRFRSVFLSSAFLSPASLAGSAA